MINFISNLFRIGKIELLHLRLNLIYTIILTLVGALPILIFKPAVGICFYITVVPWLITAYCLFSITRYIHMHIAGEAFEFLDETSDAISRRMNNAPAGRRYSTGILDNPFIQIYRRVISGIFFLQTALFLMLPLYVNYTEGGLTTGIIIAMLATVIIIGSFTFFTKLFRFAITMTVISYSVGLLFVLFPQPSFYAAKIKKEIPGHESAGVGVATSTMKLANELRAVEEQQKRDRINNYIKSVIAWKKKHPNEKLSKEHEDALARAGVR